MIGADSSSTRRTRNSWKHLSFVLIGILAFGVSVTTLPQAMAKPPEGSPGEDMMAILQQIKEIVLGVKDRTDNLPDDPASTSDVATKTYGSQVISHVGFFAGTLTATSDRDFNVCYLATNGDPGSTFIVIGKFDGPDDGDDDGAFSIGLAPGEESSGCIGADADGVITFAHTSGNDLALGVVTLTTSADATASITQD